MQKRWVVVTGAAGGLGAETARRLSGAGWSVVAADLPGDALDAMSALPGVVTVPVDVTDMASVEQMADTVREHTDRLDGVINFAGILVVGAMFEIPEADFGRIMDINLMGTYRVNRALFDLVETGGGRIINLSSETGWQTAWPFGGAYAISKHAIEAYSDALRREASLVGVTVIKVQPGPFRTAMTGGITRAFDKAAEDSTHFEGLLARMGKVAGKENDKANDPAILAAVMEEALTADRPKVAYSVKPALSRVVVDKLPTGLADRAIGAVMRRLNT